MHLQELMICTPYTHAFVESTGYMMIQDPKQGNSSASFNQASMHAMYSGVRTRTP